jgi:hypothetical protein
MTVVVEEGRDARDADARPEKARREVSGSADAKAADDMISWLGSWDWTKLIRLIAV